MLPPLLLIDLRSVFSRKPVDHHGGAFSAKNYNYPGKMLMKLRMLAAAAVICLFNCSGAAFASVVTETIDFNNNQMPSGWSFFNPGNKNIHIQNGRLEVGQVDATGGIFRAFNSTGVSRLVVDYDGNIVPIVFASTIAVPIPQYS